MRAGWGLLLLLLAPALHALDVTVGSSFTIKNITREGGKVVLPVERQKYYNVRILAPAAFDFVQTCTEPCVQPLSEVVPSVQEVRPAQTRANMWLVSVVFNRAWLITCLVFKRGETYAVEFPADFVFLDKKLEEKTRTLVVQRVQEAG